MNNNDKCIYIGCDCGCEVLRLEYDKDNTNENLDFLYIAIYDLPHTPSWKWILKYIWFVIKNKKPYQDQIILHKDSFLKLKEYINNIK